MEWMQGLDHGWVTSTNLTRTQQLRILGAGVVPQQASAALQTLSASTGLPALPPNATAQDEARP